ncbi:hypothetical protein LOTGIDRAFT_118120 [Lottia gigantea]|uniref:Transmembrane protein 53 n=1 Tax=Lottia gigantea TaxID=225164 RepID=V4ALV0_LOTGI|nr:hypothetical protein LOTGIDRAFT_118120 [Lottia gigantea]ESO94571.1 hypothetical protein LOTGIDRAFT_118120 [Lottia gigantea]
METQFNESFQVDNLVIIFPWYAAKPDQVAKYQSLYHGRGFDTLVIYGGLVSFLWPQKASEFVKSVNNLLETRFDNYKHFILHAFSIGAFYLTVYIYTSFEKENVSSSIKKKTLGVFWDSITIGELSNLITGIATGAGLTGNFAKIAFKSSFLLYYYLFNNCTARIYNKYFRLLAKNPWIVPTFVVASKDDPMSDYKALSELLNTWTNKLPILKYKIWDHSKHAGHLKYHYSEYVEILDSFLSVLKNRYPSKIMSKL